MTRILAVAAFGIATLGLAACTNPDGSRNNAATGATVGALGGAAAGQIIGGDTTSTMLGAGLGAATGAVIGNQRDRQQTGM